MTAFRIPTRVHVEPGSVARLPALARGLGFRHALLVTDRGMKESGCLDRVAELLGNADLPITVFDAVEANPRTTTAERIGEVAREAGVDGVVALGGGSVLDAAKAAAMLATNGGRAQHFEGKNRYGARPLPMIAIPTTCGTGSEVTWVAVLTHEATGSKISVKGESMFPNHAVVDADLLCTLPSQLVAWTGLDALTHALEATTSTAANPVSDALAEKAIVLLMSYLERAAADIAGDAEARAEVMRAATLAGLAFGNADVAAVHCLSETLGGLYDLPHGLANAVLLVPVLRYHRPVIEGRLAELDGLLRPGHATGSTSERAEGFLTELEGLVERLEIPSFASFEIPADSHPEIAERAAKNGSNGSNPQPMATGNYLEILAGFTD